eukprot:8927486-Lingulodinium_polyedra.AAC.1
MADALRSHWSGIFTAGGIDRGLLKKWVDEDIASGPSGAARSPLRPFPKLRRSHIKQAIDSTGNTSPGPDGIPFAAWRKCRDLAADVLFDAFGSMCSDGSTGMLDEHWQ